MVKKINKKEFLDPNGTQFRTRALFVETVPTVDMKDSAIYTFQEEDYGKFISIWKIYLSYNDLTEYQFAVDNFHSWEHWEAIAATVSVSPYVRKMRKALRMKLKSQALAKIMNEASNPDNKNFYSANKFLLENDWVSDEQSIKPSREVTRDKVGRPTKEKIREAAIQLFSADDLVKDDLQRITKDN